ncbi:hypothetical protein [Actinomadura sp. 7K507]|uniref:hypothetical protein n=1 Tax=Actinomadura sp. 7K507 TaxID=2530365 RepID=UPI0010447B21|nr:hypothetical protein [Actinomadura sp. 7K507]TDC80854.1 hypothetical protein E1285_34015 [Actinomadura sp. 7K507]
MRPGRDRGEGAVSHIAVILVIAAAVAVVATSPVGGKIAGGLESAICEVSGGGGCGIRSRAGDGEPPLTSPPTPGGSGPEGQPREPSPSPGPPVEEPPPPPKSTEQIETEAVLNETQAGRDALRWVEDNGVRVVYRNGGGSYWSDADNVFYIDTSQTPVERANTFIHEVNHAKNRNVPDPKEMSREEYIDAAIEEETQGVIDEIENNQELQRLRGKNAPPDTLLQAEYEAAYRDAVNAENKARAQAQRPPLTPGEERRVGEAAGRQRVKEAFENGEVVSSVDGNTYPDNYGDAWDDANKSCFLWIFC